MKFITCTGHYGGFGAQVQAVMSALLYAHCTGAKYVHTPFKLIEWGENPAVVENFFNLGLGELRLEHIDPSEEIVPGVTFHEFADNNADRYVEIMPRLREKYFSTPKPALDMDYPSVVFHVRRACPGFDDSGRISDIDRVFEIYTILRSLAFPFQFHICSHNTSKSVFSRFEGVSIHIDEDTLTTFHRMVMADVFIMAKSSLSYAVALLSTGCKVYERFWHSPMKAWFQRPDMNGLREFVTDFLSGETTKR